MIIFQNKNIFQIISELRERLRHPLQNQMITPLLTKLKTTNLFSLGSIKTLLIDTTTQRILFYKC